MNRAFTIALLLAILTAHAAFAQVDRATLTGTVKDTAGAVVPGVTISLTNLGTNAALHQQTTGTSEYLFVSLIPGRYQIDAELNGFKKHSEIEDWGSRIGDWGSGIEDWGSRIGDWGSGFEDQG